MQNGRKNSVVPQAGHTATHGSQQSEEHDNNTNSSTTLTGDSTQNGRETQKNSHDTNSSTASTRNSTHNGGGNSVVPQVEHTTTHGSQQSNQSVNLVQQQSEKYIASSVAAISGGLKNPTKNPKPNSNAQAVIPSHQANKENSHNTNSSTTLTRNSTHNGRENSVVPQETQKNSRDTNSSTASTRNPTQNGGGSSVVPQAGHATTHGSQQSEEHDNNTINHLRLNGEQKKHGHAQPLNKAQQQELQSLVKNLDAAMKQSINTYLTKETNEKAIDSLDDAMNLLENGKMTMGLLLLFERAIDTAEQQHSEIDHGCGGIHNNFFTKKDKLTKNLAEIKKLLTRCPE